MKILGLDFGSKTVGVAVYNDSVDFTYPLNTIFREKESHIRQTLREIDKIIITDDIKKIVVGVPLSIEGKETNRSLLCREFGEKLLNRYKEKGIDVVFQDEKLSTFEASEILTRNNIKKSEQKKYIDSVAAVIILEEFVRNN